MISTNHKDNSAQISCNLQMPLCHLLSIWDDHCASRTSCASVNNCCIHASLWTKRTQAVYNISAKKSCSSEDRSCVAYNPCQQASYRTDDWQVTPKGRPPSLCTYNRLSCPSDGDVGQVRCLLSCAMYWSRRSACSTKNSRQTRRSAWLPHGDDDEPSSAWRIEHGGR